jgi:vancomycin resistance protein YoaR
MKVEIKEEQEKATKEVTNQIIKGDLDKKKSAENKTEKIKKYNNYELNNKKKEKSKNSKKIWIIALIILLVIAVLVFLYCTIFALINANSDSIIQGVSINGVDVSGLTKNDAKEKIESICNEKIEKEINIKYEEYESTINLGLIEAQYDIDKAIDNAFNIGRDGNIFTNNFEILNCKKENKNVDLDVSINEEEAINLFDDISISIPGYVEEASYYIEDNNLIITRGKDGIRVDNESLLNLLYEEMLNFNESQEYIEIPVTEIKPEDIDIDKIYEEVYKEAQDAYYTKDPFTIYPEVEGVNFDVEAAKEMIKEEKDEYTIELIITKPSVTTKDIGTEAFPDLLGTCSTKYNASDTDRTTNLKLASEKINGTVLLPGEEFSYNTTVGERTIEAGYKEAATFSNGQVVPGLGGGICQISSTLYDAVVFANLDVTVRRNHQFVTSYLEAGKDATVVWGSQDFKFVNTRDYPVRIVSSVSGGVATVSIYGVKQETEYDISIETKLVSTIQYTTVYKDSSSLAVGTEQVQQNGANGRVVEAYKVTKLNGAVVSKTLLSKDTYNAKQKIILRGTATNNTTNNTTNNATNSSTSSSSTTTETTTNSTSASSTVTIETPEVSTSVNTETSTEQSLPENIETNTEETN